MILVMLVMVQYIIVERKTEKAKNGVHAIVFN